MMSYNMDFYKAYLAEVSEISEIDWVRNYLDLRKRPNFWTIIEYGRSTSSKQRSAHEIRYAKMLRWLLDANENHNLGNLFAHKFLEKLKLSYTYSPDKNKLIDAHTEALKEDVDIFYEDISRNLCVAIELKQFAKEGNAQLKKYEKAVGKFIKEKASEIEAHFIYLTPLKEASSDPEVWIAAGYKELIEVLQELTEHVKGDYEDDILKIIHDFIEDLQRSMDLLLQNSTSFNEKLSKVQRNFTFQLAKEIREYDESTHLDKLTALSDNIELQEIILLIDEYLHVQNHAQNNAVRLLMRKIFHHLAEDPQLPEVLDKEYGKNDPKRFAPIKPDIIKKYKLDVEKVELTQNKGQGIKLHHVNGVSIYFSGDTYGNVPNDKVHFIKKDGSKNRKISGNITATTFHVDMNLINNDKVYYEKAGKKQEITIEELIHYIMFDVKMLNDQLNDQ